MNRFLYPSLFFLILLQVRISAQETVITYEEAFQRMNGQYRLSKIKSESMPEDSIPGKANVLENDYQPAASSKMQMPPANDDCSNAITLTIGGGDYVYSNVGATAAPSDPTGSGWSSCTGGGANNVMHSVWFKFTVTGGPQNITVSSQGPSNNGNASAYKAKYAVFSGTCGSFTEIGVTRGGSYGNFNSKSINIANLANGTYFIVTDGMCSETGDYRIRVDVTPPGAPTLWYAAGTIPTLSTGVALTTGGQWGTYASTSEANPSCGGAGLGFSDWYQFVYNSATQDHIGITDQALQSGFYIGLYDAAGTQLVCNKWGQADYASYTWDYSVQDAVAMHMPNISLKELGLVNGATYYVRIANTSTSAWNVNTAAGKIYTVRLGNYATFGDCYLDNQTLTLTQQPTHSWLTGQSNRYAGHSMLSEPEQGNLAWNIDNSLLYKFNTNSATAVEVKLQNVTYYNHSASTAQGQIAILTSPTVGTSVASNAAFTGATFTLSASGLTAATDYWILIDGRGTYEGTRLTFDISVSTTMPLPVELISFTAYNNGEKNILDWVTVSENHSDYFSVEKSLDAIQFYEIAKVKAAGNSRIKRYYSAVDDDARTSGTVYYRLKQVDLDKSFAYSSVVAVSGNGKKPGGVMISPNPSNSVLNVVIPDKSAIEAQVSIQSLTGQIIRQKHVCDLRTGNVIQLDVSALSKGIYFLSVEVNQQTEWIKFVKE